MRLARCVLLCSAPFFGAAAASAHNPPSNDDRVTIDVSAKIAERCGLSADGATSSSNSNLDAATSIEFNFKIDCNTRFRIGVSSANGALRLVNDSGSPASNQDGFSTEKEYKVDLRVGTDGTPLTPDQCTSRSLTATSRGACDFYGAVAGQGLSSGQRTAIDRRGKLTVSWPASDDGGPRRIAGTYSDTLTIVVGVRS